MIVNDVPYAPMNAAELKDISIRAGRKLSENEALIFLQDERIKKLKELEFRARTAA